MAKNTLKVTAVAEVYTTRQKVFTAFKRFCRVVVPQLPGLVLTMTDVIGTKWLPLFVFLGSAVTALDKFLRDLEWY